ncbi:IS1096 element passenger TnpR family protein [Mucilaginibacter myungsuensis]|uniref:Plasmid pRiA4b Orf3-like domain-containing protein n=1 Tax=Mucilaginibacter myungsuensis TaxID=649104 RepID=A0A929KXM9_9SPHI|nr:hypothetical protein [Mucilaginibacter myungsuensis]MBE9662395.1 hypothetical protein [Mucilaginibacter myungsuensis]MDN3599168.1 hypothetical protein [Mucilaginibacter myungsuensis]
MALYRFKVTFEDYDDVTREIDIKSNQTFEDLHRGIQKSTGYDAERPSSFYVSTDQWVKGEEFTFLPNQKRQDRGIALMEKVKLSSFIDDPHQKFYYTYNFDRPYDFHVELMKIILDEDPKITYPYVVKSVGEAPRMVVNVDVPTAAAATDDDFDFLNEVEFNPEDAEDFAEVDEHGENTESSDEDDHADDEMDEFADNEHMEDEGESYGRGGRGDDY